MNGGSTVTEARILIVDDEPWFVRFLELLLRSEGYTNITSTTRSCFAPPLLAELGPDLLVLDLHMPYLTGFEIMDTLKSRIPTMIITGDPRPEVRRRALESGIELVAKPFDVNEVLERIRRMLNARFRHLAQQEEPSEPRSRRELSAAEV